MLLFQIGFAIGFVLWIAVSLLGLALQQPSGAEVWFQFALLNAAACWLIRQTPKTPPLKSLKK